MCQKIKVFPEEVNTIYKDGIVYVSMSEYLKTVETNVLLTETLRDVCRRGVSVEARNLCGLSEPFSESQKFVTP
jgi:hypothetical protein